jgi:hypothetical protein
MEVHLKYRLHETRPISAGHGPPVSITNASLATPSMARPGFMHRRISVGSPITKLVLVDNARARNDASDAQSLGMELSRLQGI